LVIVFEIPAGFSRSSLTFLVRASFSHQWRMDCDGFIIPIFRAIHGVSHIFKPHPRTGEAWYRWRHCSGGERFCE